MPEQHFHKELDNLRSDLLKQGERVERSINDAIRAFLNRDEDMANHVIENDYEIDDAEIEIEEEFLKLLALYQPIANDLRFLVATIKINNDLERIGDLASNICERVLSMPSDDPLDVQNRFENMTEKVENMVHQSLTSLIEKDQEKAEEVRYMDDDVDQLHEEMFQVLHEKMVSDEDVINVAIHTLSVSRYLERIADHATNIAEDVIYMMEGRIVRHQRE